MADFNPYDVIIRAVGRFTSEKVLNAAERLTASELDEYRKVSSEELAGARKVVTDSEKLSDLGADEQRTLIRQRLNAAKRTMAPEAFKKVRKQLEEETSLSKQDRALLTTALVRKALHHRRAMRRDLNRNQNKVVFIVRDEATKPQIKRAIEEVYDVKVVRVNTLHTRRGKRAIIKLSEADNAEDIYTRLGQM
jgi:large subunit ribosomal protein L23